MAWDFETDAEYERKLEWARRFVDEEIAPLEVLWPDMHHLPPPPWLKKVVDPLKQQVREQGLWATHLTPELGGLGFGQVQLALLNEILGPYLWAPTIFGVQGPDSGNAEILAHYGTEQQKEKYLRPLLDGDIFSCFSMTEPTGGSDPATFTTTAVKEGDEWVITGEKFFSSNTPNAAFLIVLARTSPEAGAYKGMSTFLVPGDAPGLEIIRNTCTMGHPLVTDLTTAVPYSHPHLRYNHVRVPANNLLGAEGDGFRVVQTRLGGGRVHHAMRSVGVAQLAFDMMCERALGRTAHGTPIAEKQLVQQAIADSYAEISQFRLLVLHTAWLIDRGGAASIRKEIAMCKNLGAKLVTDVVSRSMHIHGALGVSNEMPLGRLWMAAPTLELVDGPTEAHVTTIARKVLSDYSPSPGLWPRAWLPARLEKARGKYAAALAEQAESETAKAVVR